MLFVKVTKNSYFLKVATPVLKNDYMDEYPNMFPNVVNIGLVKKVILDLLNLEEGVEIDSLPTLAQWFIKKNFLGEIPTDIIFLLKEHDTIDLLNDFSNTINPHTDSVKKFLTENDLFYLYEAE